MVNLFAHWSLFVIILSHNILINCVPNWNYDIISVDIDNKSPDKVALELYVTRPARGIFAVSGTIDFKVDVTDETYLSVLSYYSASGSYFVKSPFCIPALNLSTFMNTYYKDMAMESLVNCTDNAPRIEDTFVSPLTKRVTHFNDCQISNENFPTMLKSGYYKIVFQYANEEEGTLTFLAQVEQK